MPSVDASSVERTPIGASASVVQLLQPIARFLVQDGVTELCLNRPGRLYVEDRQGWHHVEIDELSFAWSRSLAIAVASLDGRVVGANAPFLGAALPGGARIQFVLPPAVRAGTVSLTIRRAADRMMALADYEKQGLFDGAIIDGRQTDPANVRLGQLLDAGNLRAFFELAVAARKNIVVVGDTGSGKTTFMKALCAQIDLTERLVTIEDTHELVLPHDNCTHLLYDDATGISAASCLRCAMRMRPDRVLLAELRGAEAFDYLNLMMTGHAGSITSLHAQSCALAFERFAILARSHPAAGGHDESQLVRLARMVIDIVVHCTRMSGQRRLSSVHFDPNEKWRACHGNS